MGLAISPLFDNLLASKTGPQAGAWVLPYTRHAQGAHRSVCACVHERVCMMFVYSCALQIKHNYTSILKISIKILKGLGMSEKT